MSDYQSGIRRKHAAPIPTPEQALQGHISMLEDLAVERQEAAKPLATQDTHAAQYGEQSTRSGANLTLPTDSLERKNYPLLSGCLKYFPAALAGVANVSKLGNDKHNPGLPLHHARGKSMDHGDCILRHLVDTEDLISAQGQGAAVTPEQILFEASQLAWRALAYSQELHEAFGAPLAPGAKK